MTDTFNALLDRYQERGARIKELEAALRALVETEPKYTNQYQDSCCVYCEGEGAWSDTVVHAPDCPWVAAKALVTEEGR